MVYAPHPQYLTRGGIETIREYLETSSDKTISSNSLCDLASFILNQVILGPSLLLHILTCLWQGYETEFFKTVSLNVVTIP